MDFARKILSNYGWKEGDGLGKNKDGISKPLKATLKFDNAGFGSDQAAADFNNHWWERVFNEAASNVNIQKEGDQIKMVLKDDEDCVDISTTGYSMKKLEKLKKIREEDSGKKSLYENFLQAATLTNRGDEVENPDKINANDIEVFKVKMLSDEELFKACGGRTAHKGARHGLKLSGKLLRIEQQEKELLGKLLAKRNLCQENKLELKISKTEDTKEYVCIEKTKIENGNLEACEFFAVKKCKKHKKKKRRTYSSAESAEEIAIKNEEILNVKYTKRKKEKYFCEETKKISQESVQNINEKLNLKSNYDEIKSQAKKKHKNKTEDGIAKKKKELLNNM